MRKSLLCLLLLASPLWAVPPALELPAEVKGQPGAFVRVPAKTEGVRVLWVALDGGLNLFPVDLLKDSKTAVVVAPKPGRYRLLAVTSKGDELASAETVLVIGDAPPPPVPPVPPGPGPTPPVPPLPPGPDDPLAVSLRAAWAKEKAPDRAAHLATLAGVWRRAEKRAADVKYGDIGAWQEANRVDRVAVLADECLWEVRTAVATHLKTTLPRNPMAPMDAATRTLCARESARVAAALEGLK